MHLIPKSKHVSTYIISHRNIYEQCIYGNHMYEYIGDERIIPRGWPSQCGGCSLGFIGGLLQGGDVALRHGVDAGEVVERAAGVEVEEAADGGKAKDGDGSGAIVPRRSPKTLSSFS